MTDLELIHISKTGHCIEMMCVLWTNIVQFATIRQICRK